MEAMSLGSERTLVFGILPLFALACGSPATPASPAPVDMTIGGGGSAPVATGACATPSLAPAPERERGIDAFLAGRPEEAFDLLTAAVQKDRNDRAATAFRAGAAAQLEERRARASDVEAPPRVVLEPIPLARTERRAVPDVPAAKVRLEKESEKKNAITDEADWEAKNGLRPIVHFGPRGGTLPANVPLTLGGERLRSAFVHADHAVAFYERTLRVTSEGRPALAFDLGAAITRAGIPFEVMFGQLAGQTLVVELAYNGYAKESGGKNGYIAAYDAKTGALFWVSDPLTGNAREALVSGGSIVTGYGFTAEPDFVFVLDLATGKTEQKIPVKSGPELMRLKGDRLFVRTYDTDYVFKSTTGFAPAPPAIFAEAPGTAASSGPPSATTGAEARCWVQRATAAILANDAAGIREASEHLKPLSRDRTLDAVLREAEQKADTR